MKKSIYVIFLLCLTVGCATNGGLENRPLYFPTCYQPIHQANILDSRVRDAAIGAGKGFLAGTLAGLAGGAVSALFTGDPLNIVSGAAIGAAGGTVAGGVYGAMQDNEAQKNRLLLEWSNEGINIQGLSFNQAAATVALQCYNRQYKKVEKDMDLGLITLQAAQPMLTEIEVGQQEASNLYNLGNN